MAEKLARRKNGKHTDQYGFTQSNQIQENS